MPVNSTHPDYDANTAAWQRARDVLAGEDAIKAAGQRYLPKLDAQSEDDYKAYKARADFFNATARTLDALVGLAFRAEGECQRHLLSDGARVSLTATEVRAAQAI